MEHRAELTDVKPLGAAALVPQILSVQAPTAAMPVAVSSLLVSMAAPHAERTDVRQRPVAAPAPPRLTVPVAISVTLASVS